jgi:hypothetical protein
MFCWNYATVILSTPFWSKFWFLAMPPATFDERTWQVCMLEQLACGFTFSESVVVFWLTVNCESLQKRKRLNLDCRIDSFRCCINFFWWNIRIDFAWGSSVTPTFFLQPTDFFTPWKWLMIILQRKSVKHSTHLALWSDFQSSCKFNIS